MKKSKLILVASLAFGMVVAGVTPANAATDSKISTKDLYVNQFVSLTSGKTDVVSQEVPLGTPVSALLGKVSVVKSFHFDRGATGDHNFTHYKYISIPNSSRKKGYTNQKIGSGWNYVRFEHINYFTGGY